MDGDNGTPVGEYRITQKVKGPFDGTFGGYLGAAWLRCAPVKPESTWVQVPPIQLDCSGSKTASGMKPRGGTRKHDAD
jgi:hypothetical protein